MREIAKIVDSKIKFNSTPFAETTHSGYEIKLIADGVEGEKIELFFSPFQALKTTTMDCFNFFPDGLDLANMTVFEIENSLWIKLLKKASKLTDEHADFLEKSRHFLVPLQDSVFEVVAWNLKYK